MEFGVNLNNREPLITSDYTLADLNPGDEDLVMVFSFPAPDYPPTERRDPRVPR